MTANKEMLRRSLSGTPQEAGLIFRSALGDDANAREVRAFIEGNPTLALSAIRHPDQELGFSPKQSSDVCDMALGAIADPAEARTMFERYLTPARRAELVRGRGDLPSVVEAIAGLSDILLAVVEDLLEHRTQLNRPPAEPEAGGDSIETRSAIEQAKAERDDDDVDDETEEDEEGNEEEADPLQGEESTYAILYAWCYKLKSRPDYAEFLETSIGDLNLRQHLIVAVYLQTNGRPSFADFSHVGLENNQDMTTFESLLAGEKTASLDLDMLKQVRDELLQASGASVAGTSASEQVEDL